MLCINDHILLSELSNINSGTQIREYEETTQLSPSTTSKTTIYESHRTLGAGQPVLGVTSTGFRTFSPVSSSRSQHDTSDEQQIEEKYEVTLSSYDESGLKILSSEPMTTATSATGEGYLSFRKKFYLIFL
jgi:hypothetical protein